MKKVYFISGLGADKRIFSFLDLSFCEPVFVDWITPLKKETLPHYAGRMRQTITDENPLIIGMSFGGMLASEMAKAEQGIKAIIISSSKTSKEFPFYWRIGKYIPIYRWVPFRLMKSSHRLYSWIFGTKGNEERKLLKQIINNSDPGFVKWATWSILHWKKNDAPGNIVHIHGTADILLPYRFVNADYTIKNGKHMMPFDKHDEISGLLKKLIQ